MLNNKGPLMFINTVNTQIEDSSDQEVYDSSKSTEQKKKSTIQDKRVEERKHDFPAEDYTLKEKVKPKFIEERKIKNIIEMYHKDRPVLCNIISNDLEIIGIPFKLDDSLLYVKTSEDQYENIELDAITDIIIIKF